jgi:pimeloyl-ACP methyl ester carboxylesterase
MQDFELMDSRTIKTTCQQKNFELSIKLKNGSREFIVFIHGLGCTKESFDTLWNYTELFKHFSLLTFDLAGFGDSSRPKDFSYTMEDQAEICKVMLDTFKPDKVHIVAYSMGGAIGLLLAEKIGDKAASFINIEGNLISEDCGPLSRKTIHASFDEFNSRVFNKLKSAVGSSGDKNAKLWLKWCDRSDALAYYKTSKSLVDWSESGNLLKKFEALKINKAYFYGAQNFQMKVLDRLQSIRKISISNSGHFLMIDNPQEFYSTLAVVLGTGQR